MHLVLTFLSQVFLTLQQFSFFLLIGFGVSIFIRLVLKPNAIQALLGKRNFFSVLMGSLLGVPMPLCSCSVIPVSVSLRKSGASDGATVSFITSTPVTGVDSIAISFGMLGPYLAIARPIAAFVIGITAGCMQLLFGDKDSRAPVLSPEGQHLSLKENFLESFAYLKDDLFPSLANSLAIGVILAAVLLTLMKVNILPNDFVGGISTGYQWADMVIVILLGIPVYVCATGSTPIAATFIAMGMSPGLAFVFLIAGPATNITTIVTLYTMFRLKGVVVYLCTIFVGALVFGFAIDTYGDLIKAQFAMLNQLEHHHHHHEFSFVWYETVAAILLSIWFVFYYGKKITKRLFKKKIPSLTQSKKIYVEKMVCKNCVAKIETILSTQDTCQVTESDPKEHLLTIAYQGDKELDAALKLLADGGYSAQIL